MKIRLDKNEMPVPPPKEVINSVKKSIENINRYTPTEIVNNLLNSLSDYANIPKESLFLCSGSDILIKEFIYLFCRDRQIIIADPTFFLISNAAQKTGSSLLKIRLKEPEFKISFKAFIDEINKPTLVVFDNPNNPTGNLLLNQNDIKILLENENVILLLDEAYFEFSNITYAHMIQDYPNLAVCRTLSKSFGLAGSGIGYLIGGELIQKQFQGLDIILPYPSVIAAIQALQNNSYMMNYIKKINQEKQRVASLVSKLGLTAYPSYTNFLLMKSEINDLAQKLAEYGVLISDVSKNYSLSSEFIRVTIGTEEENDYFLDSLKKIQELQI